MIRPAAPEDLEELAELMAGSGLLQRYRVTKSSALQSLVLAFQEGDVVLVHCDSSAIQEGDVVLGHHRDSVAITGFAWLTFAPRVLNGAAYLRLLLVAEGRRGGGVGAQLLAEVEQRAEQYANHMYLLATSDNHAARRFYERHGYRYVGELPGLVWPDLDEVLYHKPLREG